MPRWPGQTRVRHLFPRLEATPDLNRGDIRLAAEVLLERLNDRPVPEFAMTRALRVAGTMARG
jgi:hypothetical protein